MATKVIFVAFAIEAATQRDFLKGHALNPKSPFEYTDMSVKEAYDEEWKKKVRTRILRSDGVIATETGLSAPCETYSPVCNPSAWLKLESIVQRFGWDFDIVDGRQQLRGRLA